MLLSLLESSARDKLGEAEDDNKAQAGRYGEDRYESRPPAHTGRNLHSGTRGAPVLTNLSRSSGIVHQFSEKLSYTQN